MHLLTWHLLLDSLYSVKVPFTYQSSLVYPLPPPSTLKGLLANALQRWEGIGPLEALRNIESHVRFVAAVPLEPIVLHDYIVSNVVNMRGRGKATDALSRQFAYTRELAAVAASENAGLMQRLAAALARTAVYLGDNESLVTCHAIHVEAAVSRQAEAGTCLELHTYLPVPTLTDYAGDRDIYWVQTECWRPQSLRPYLFPLVRDGSVLRPAPITGRLAQPLEVVDHPGLGPLLVPPQPTLSRRRRRQNQE